MHVYEVYDDEAHAYEMHADEAHAYKVQAYEVHLVRRDIHKAAEITGRKPKHLEWEILGYANRCKKARSGPTKLAQMGSMAHRLGRGNETS
jgi:hypothetical protein